MNYGQRILPENRESSSSFSVASRVDRMKIEYKIREVLIVSVLNDIGNYQTEKQVKVDGAVIAQALKTDPTRSDSTLSLGSRPTLQRFQHDQRKQQI